MDHRTLNQVITLQAPQVAQDADGAQAVTGWKTYAVVRANVDTINARTVQLAQTYADSISHRLRIRYRPDVATTHRALFEGKALVIDGIVDEKEKHQTLLLYCTQLRTGG